MGTDWDGYRAKTDKAAVAERNADVDRRHDRWARERMLADVNRSRKGSPVSRVVAGLKRALGRR